MASTGSREGGSTDTDVGKPNIAKDIGLLSLLLAPAYLNDFLLIYATSRKEVLLIDYASKALPLLILAFVPSLWSAVRVAVATRPDWRWTAVFVPICMISLPVLHILELALWRILPNIQLFSFPSFKGPEWYWFDLIFGLTLNSVSEELVDRGIVAAILLRHGLCAGIVILVSALLFGSAHWSKGLPNIVVAVLYGILFMTMYLKTRSIWPGVAVHTVDNVIAFA